MKRSVKCCHGGEAQEKIVYYIHKLQSQEARHSTQGHQEKKAGCQEAEGAEASGGFCHCFYRNFHRKGKAEQRKQPGLAGLNNFGGLRARRVVSSCPLPGPGMIMTEEYCLPGCMGQIEMLWLWTG